jgi:N-acetylglucosamine kinase-like BadF-type ATPase
MNQSAAVGVDAGGTATLAIASRHGVESGRGCAGPANASSHGIDAAAQTIACAVAEAAGDAAAFTLFVGAAGAGRAKVARGLEEALRALLPRAHAVRVEDDARIALRAAILEGPGIALIAGTGSIAYAENGERAVRVGGAGWLLSDEGSGFAIGLAALRSAVRAFDGRTQSDEVTELVGKTFDAHDRDALLAAAYDAACPNLARIAGLAAGVIASASQGRRSATKIVQAAASDLASLACAAAEQADMTERSPMIALCGGLLRENSLLTYVLNARLQADLPGATVVRAEQEPASVALRFACEEGCAQDEG